ncbi:MAG: 6-pyruvoyl-tetrahydropterin synthase-related protein [Nanoarchaeota archaeon]
MKEYQKNIIAVIIIVIVGLLIFREMFTNEGFLIKSDNPVHMIEAKYLADEIIPEHKWINGWYPYEYAGQPIQVYTYQLGIWLVVLIYYLGINIFLAYKIAFFIAALLPAIALYFILRKRYGIIPALITGTFFLFQRDYTKLYLAGMWSQAIGIALLIITIYLLDKYSDKINLKRSLTLGIIFALIILAHPFVTITAIYLIGTAAIINALKTKNYTNIKYYLLIGITGIILTLFYLYPYFETSGWYLTEYGWGLGDNIIDILYTLTGMFLGLKPHTIVFTPIINGQYTTAITELVKSIYQNLPVLLIDLFFIIGLVYYRKEKNKEEKKLLYLVLIFIIISLILGTGFWYLFDFGRKIPLFGAALSYRFVYYAKTGLFIIAAYGLYKTINNHKEKIRKISYLILGIIIIGLILGSYKAPESYTETSGTTALYEETITMWKYLEHNTDKNARILNQNTYGNIQEPSITYDAMLSPMANYYNGLNYIGSWYTTVYPLENKFNTEDNKIFGIKIEEITEEELKKNLEIYNAKYIITLNNEWDNKLKNFKTLKEIYRSENYAVYDYETYKPEWIISKNKIDYTINNFNDQDIKIKINNLHQQNNIVIKIAEHPYWKAYINEKEIEVNSDENKLIKIEIPEGEYELDIKYQPRKIKYVLLSFIGLISLIILNRYRSI